MHSPLFPYGNMITHGGHHSSVNTSLIGLCYQFTSDTTPSFYLVNQLTVVESGTNPTNCLEVYLHKNKVATVHTFYLCIKWGLTGGTCQQDCKNLQTIG